MKREWCHDVCGPGRLCAMMAGYLRCQVDGRVACVSWQTVTGGVLALALACRGQLDPRKTSALMEVGREKSYKEQDTQG